MATTNSVKPPVGAAPPAGAKPNKAHSSWHAMLVNMFVDVPKELHSSRKAREAIGGLRHRKGLR